MTVHPGTLMSIDSFLDWCAGQEGRYELSGGVLTPMMTPSTLPHALISRRIGADLDQQLSGSGLVATVAQRGAIAGVSYRVPDVIVEKPIKGDRSVSSSHPVVIVEILSESTKAVDFGPKVREYLDLPTLTAYVIVSQSRPEAWMWERGANGLWPNAPTYVQAGNSIGLRALHVEITFDSLFAGIPLNEAEEP